LNKHAEELLKKAVSYNNVLENLVSLVGRLETATSSFSVERRALPVRPKESIE
jgi:hypothetical protein